MTAGTYCRTTAHSPLARITTRCFLNVFRSIRWDLPKILRDQRSLSAQAVIAPLRPSHAVFLRMTWMHSLRILLGAASLLAAEPSFQPVLHHIRIQLWPRRSCFTQRWRSASTATNSQLRGTSTGICTLAQVTTSSLASPALHSPSSVYKAARRRWAAHTHRLTAINLHPTVAISRRWVPMCQCKAQMRRRRVPPGIMAYPTSNPRES